VAELRIRDLDDNTHKQLRHLAVDLGKSLNTLVKELIEDGLARLQERKPPRKG